MALWTVDGWDGMEFTALGGVILVDFAWLLRLVRQRSDCVHQLSTYPSLDLPSNGSNCSEISIRLSLSSRCTDSTLPMRHVISENPLTLLLNYRTGLVPDAPRPVMGQRLLALRLQLLHGVVQEEVDEDRVDLRLRVLALDLAPDLLDAPDGGG